MASYLSVFKVEMIIFLFLIRWVAASLNNLLPLCLQHPRTESLTTRYWKTLPNSVKFGCQIMLYIINYSSRCSFKKLWFL